MKKGYLILLFFIQFFYAEAQPPGNALNFDGTNDNVSIPLPGFNPAKVSVETWVYWTPTNPSEIQFICSKGLGAGTELFEIQAGGNGVNSLRILPSPNVYIDVANALPVNRWTHVAYVHDPSANLLKVYVNGVDMAYTKSGTGLISSPLAVNNNIFSIGKRSANAYYFKGSIDEFRFWNVARTQLEIQASMINTVSQSVSGLAVYYNFDASTGTSLFDQTSNGFTGTLNNFALTGSTSNWVESYAMVVPTATAATAITATGFTANWTAPVIGTVNNGYRLDVSASPTFATLVSGYSGLTVAGTSQAVAGLAAGTTYYYRVRAEKTSVAGMGSYSSGQSVTTPAFSTNANLSALTINSGTLSPGFAPATTSYTASVANTTNSLTVTPTLGDATAVVKVNGISVASGSASGAIALSVGSNTITVVVTAQDGTTTNTYSLAVSRAKADPVIRWANPADIVYGTALSATQLNATSATAGTYTYTPASGATLNAGSNQSLSVSFTPTDDANFNIASKQVSINVSKATPVITWANPADITYGTSLSATQLNATSATSGTFTYTPASGATLNAGSNQSLSVSFTPTDAANFNIASKQVSINVSKATSLITWANPADITYGTSLSATQLNATSATPGTFTYTPASGATLNAGSNQSLSVSFTPTDATNFNNATKQVIINVAKATQTITFAALPPKAVGDAAFTLSATSSSGLTVTFTSSNTAVATIVGNTVTIVGVGTSTITASQSGNANLAAAADVIQTLTVNKAAQTITFAALPAKSFGDAAFTLSGSSSSGLALTYTSSNASVATISGSTVTIVGAGTSTITASQAGNANYAAAPNVVQTLTVSPASMQAPGNALNFDGINDNVSIPLSGFNPSKVTIETWVYWTPTTASDVQFICAKGYEQFEIHTGSNGPNSLRIIPSPNVYIDVANALPVNRWTHIAYVHDPSSTLLKVYVNGVKMQYTTDAPGSTGYISNPLVANSTNFSIGSRSPNEYYFKGSIDEFRIWNVARTQAEIQASMVNTVSPSVSGLAAYYNFDSSTGTSLFDQTSNGFTGTLNNFALTGSTSNWVESYAMVVPTATAATAITATGFTANWTAPVIGTVNNGYRLDVSASPTFATLVSGYSGLTVAGTSQAVAGLAAGTTYYYRVRAEKTSVAGMGSYSSGQSVTTSAFSTNANLSALTISSGTLSPVYAPATTSYAATVANATNTLTVTPTLGDATAVVRVNGITIASGSASGAIALNVGSNTITVVVTAQDGTTTKTYSLAVTRAKADQSITFGALPAKAFGDAAFALSGTSTSGLALTYTSSNASVATISGNTVTIVGVGTSTITAKQAGNSNYSATTDVAQTLTVNKAAQTITFAALPAKSFSDAAFTLSGTSSSGLALTYTSSNSSVATIVGNTVTIVDLGTSIITAKQAGNSNYSAATDVAQTLTVSGNAPQTIAFTPVPVKTFGDAAFTLSATSSSGLTVTFTSSNTAVATIVGNTVTIVGAGTSTITASQSGNANYAAAANAEQTLTVNKAAQSITFAELPTKSFGDAAFTLSGTSSSGLAVTFTSSNMAVATISGNIVTIVGAGTSTITASQSGNENYSDAVDVAQTLTVSQATQTVTFSALPAKSFGDAAFTLSGSSSSGLAVTFTSSNMAVATISGNTVTIVGAGTSTITASQSGSDNYSAAVDAAQTLTVSQAAQTVTFAPLPAKSFGDAAFTLSGSSSSGLAVTFTSSNMAVATISGNTVTIVGAGTSTITASQSGSDNYSAAVDASQTLAVSQAAQTVTFAPLPAKSFGDAIFNLSGTSSSGLALTYLSNNASVATIEGNTVTIVGAGTSTITASQSGSDNYTAATDVAQTLTVDKAEQAITFSALPAKTLTDAAFALEAMASSNLPVTYTSSNTAVATISGSTTTIVGAGTTTITASQGGNNNYNAATAVAQILTVTTKQSQTITFANLPVRSFGDAAFTLAATASSQLPVSYASSNTAVATISGNTVTIVGAGTSIIAASQFGNDAFAAATSVTQTLTVNKANQTISFAAFPPKIVGSAAFSITATGGASGLPVTFVSSNTSVATISGSTVTIVAPGTTNITASQAGNANYNSAADVVQVLTVTAKQNQTITFAALADKTLADATFALSASASSGLAVAYSTTSDKITISGTQVTLVKAGRASIVANQAGNDSFNAATAVMQSFCIKPAKPTITLSNNNTETVTLNSSAASGNQWYSAGTAIAGATNATLAVAAPGVYKVQVKVDDCISDFSADQTILVTGDINLDAPSISIFPNPVDDVMQLSGIVGEIKSYQLFDLAGRTSSQITLEKKNEVYRASVEHLAQGVHLLRILLENKVVQLKFIKK